MKKIFYLLLSVLLLSTCNEDEPTIQVPTDPEPEVVLIDSVQLSLLNLDVPGAPDNFLIGDFTARIPGFIWGSTHLHENGDNFAALFSYSLANNRVSLFAAPTDLGVSNFHKIEAGPDGKLYVHSSGVVHKAVAVFDTNTGAWSTIEVAGFVSGIAVDQVNNILWIAHNEGVSRYQDGELFTFDDTNSNLQRREPDINNSFFGFALAVDEAGVVWYANQVDLYTFTNEQWALHPLSPLSSNYIITHIVPAETGGVFVKTPNESLYVLDAEAEIRNYNEKEELTNPINLTIDILDRANDESIIYSYNNGFSYYNALLDSLILVDYNNSLLPERNMQLKLDRDLQGNIWIGGNNVLGTIPNEW